MSQGAHLLRHDGQPLPTARTDQIEFVRRGGAYTGAGDAGRVWHIVETFVGWRLEFRDPGDPTPTYAGMHGSVDAAKREANWDYRGRRHPVPPQRRR